MLSEHFFEKILLISQNLKGENNAREKKKMLKKLVGDEKIQFDSAVFFFTRLDFVTKVLVL